MLELKIIDRKPGEIIANFKELKLEIAKKVEIYKTCKVNEQNELLDINGNVILDEKGLPLNAKTEKARLNRSIDMINDMRIAEERKFLEPFNKFFKQPSNEIILIINEGKDNLDTQLKEYEEERIEEKKIQIANLWHQYKYTKVSLNQIYDTRWENKGTTLAKIEEDINNWIIEIDRNLATIHLLAKDDRKKELDLSSKYLLSLDFNKTVEDYDKEEEKRNLVLNTKKEEVIHEEEMEIEVEEYTIAFEVVASKSKLQTLSKFLKENGYNYTKIENKKENK